MISLVPFTPESPRWLLSKNRREEATRNMRRLRTKAERESGAVEQEIQVIDELVQESKTKTKARWQDVTRGTIPRRVWVSQSTVCAGSVADLIDRLYPFHHFADER